jgi:hypothetical protein
MFLWKNRGSSTLGPAITDASKQPKNAIEKEVFGKLAMYNLLVHKDGSLAGCRISC